MNENAGYHKKSVCGAFCYRQKLVSRTLSSSVGQTKRKTMQGKSFVTAPGILYDMIFMQPAKAGRVPCFSAVGPGPVRPAFNSQIWIVLTCFQCDNLGDPV